MNNHALSAHIEDKPNHRRRSARRGPRRRRALGCALAAAVSIAAFAMAPSSASAQIVDSADDQSGQQIEFAFSFDQVEVAADADDATKEAVAELKRDRSRTPTECRGGGTYNAAAPYILGTAGFVVGGTASLVVLLVVVNPVGAVVGAVAIGALAAYNWSRAGAAAVPMRCT
jgi:hypothetical protein